MTSMNQFEILQLDVPEVIDWRNVPWRNPNNDREFTAAQQKEIALFQTQHRFVSARRKRYDAYQDKLSELQRIYDYTEATFSQNIINPFKLSIWTNDIAETRKRNIPAYVFDRFLDLPKEIQYMIWSHAVGTGERKTHILLPMSIENRDFGTLQRDTHNPSRTTSIYKPYYNGYGPSLDEGPVTLIQVCPDAHRAYRNMYSSLQCESAPGAVSTRIYNTGFDQFYMGERPWTEFKVLIDMIIMQNTTRPICPSVASKVAALQNICHLTVDLNIFGGAPASIWRMFTKLKVLTIAFYPFKTIRDLDRSMDPHHDPYEDELVSACNLVFTKSLRNKKFAKRAETIKRLATSSLKVAAATFPTWKLPILDVVMKELGDEELDSDAEHDEGYFQHWVDNFEEEHVDQSDPDPDGHQQVDEIDQNSRKREIEEDDSEYLDQLPLRLSHPPVSAEQIKRWKQRFHPSRRRTYLEAVRQKASSDSTPLRVSPYYADSEGGSGDERPYSGIEHPGYS